MIITIDGPTASGKSTVAALIAKKLGFFHLNTGFLYRSLAYVLVVTFKYSENDLENVRSEDITECVRSDFFSYTYDTQKDVCITYKGADITRFLKDSLVDRYVAIISPQKLVREAMVEQQRAVAQKYNLVVDGRDVGSLVFPHANFKFYLTASLPVRAARWQKDQKARGTVFTLEEAEVRVHDRDVKDMSRKISPLAVPVGGIEIDNSTLTLDETVQKILSYIMTPCC
jgi:cytidylate kinase